jgi:hypothetical protein
MGTFPEKANVKYRRFPTKENKLPFSVSVFRLQQTKGSFRFLHINIYI